MHEYEGSFTIDAAGVYGYEDIEPPYREGYAFEIEKADFIVNGNDTANTMGNIFIGLSAKSPARTSYALADGLAGDLVRLLQAYFVTDDRTIVNGDCCANGMRRAEGNELFLTKLRIFGSARSAVATDKSINIRYRIRLKEVKLSQRDKDELLKRQYGC
jgi:hypothetical protein